MKTHFKKSFLALLLALCTVLVSVPALALPAIAAEETVYEYKTSFNSETNMPSFDGTLTSASTKLTTRGNWVPMGYLKSNGYSDPSKAYPSDTYVSALINNATVAMSNEWPSGIAGWANKSSFIVNTNGTQPTYWATNGQFNVTDEMSAGMRYTAERTGVIDIVFDKLGNYATAADCIGLSNFRYGIFVNGTMVWPVEGGTLSATSALTANKTNYTAVTGLSIKAGDIIEFICEAQAEAHNWTGAGNVMFPTIGYTESSYKHSSVFNASRLPGISGIYSDPNWGIYDYANRDFGVAENGLILDSATALGGVWVDKGLSANYPTTDTGAPQWAHRAHVVLDGSINGNFFNEKGQIAVGKNSSAAIRYTAEKNGTVDIEINRLANTAPSSNATFTYSVMINGVSHWSTTITTTSGTTYGTILANSIPESLRDLPITKGDLIEFTIRSNGANGIWDGAGSIFYASVHYTEVDVAPTAAVNVLLGDKFEANGKVTLPYDITASEAGLYVDGVKKVGTLEDGGYYLVESFFKTAAKETGKPVTIQPYYIAGGIEEKGNAVTTSIAAILRRYLDYNDSKIVELATATLNYAAAAQVYFGYDTENLVNEGLAATLPQDEYTDNFAITEAKPGATVAPYEIALLLNDTVDLYVKIATKSDAVNLASFKLAIAQNADMSGSVTIAIDERGVATVKAIGPANWNDTYYFRIVDGEGNAASATFTYGVSTYYARMSENEDANLSDLVKSMMALYEANEAYRAPYVPGDDRTHPDDISGNF